MQNSNMLSHVMISPDFFYMHSCVYMCVSPASLKISLGCEIPVSAQGLGILICLGKLLH